MADQDQQDYQDYQDYLEYQKHLSGQSPTVSTSAGAFGRSASPTQSPTQEQVSSAPDRFMNQLANNMKKSIPNSNDPKSVINSVIAGPATNIGMASAADLIPKAISGVKNFLKPAAQRSEVLDKVKDIGQLEPYVQDKVREAQQGFNAKQVGTPMAMQKSMMTGNTIKLDPEELSGISPELDKYAESIKGNGPVEIPAEEGLKIRAMLNDQAGWKAHPLDPTKAQALDSKVAGLHQKLSGQMQSIDPAMAGTSEDMQQAYKLQKDTFGRGSNPISKITSDTPTQQSRLARFDEGAGSDLATLGKNIGTAQDRLKPASERLKDLFNVYKSPQTAARAVSDPITRTYDATAQKAIPLLEKLRQSRLPEAIGNSGPIIDLQREK